MDHGQDKSMDKAKNVTLPNKPDIMTEHQAYMLRFSCAAFFLVAKSEEFARTWGIEQDIPLDTSPWFSRWISFWWLNKLFRISSKRRLEVEDLFQISSDDKSDTLLKNFDREWNKELQLRESGSKPSLLRALLRLHGFGYLMLSIPCLIAQSGRAVYPILIGLLVESFLPQSTASKTEQYLYALGLCITAFGIIFFEQLYYFKAYRFGWQLRVALSAAVYRKTLKLSSGAVSRITTGRIVNILANDMLKFNDVTKYLTFLWVGTATAIAMIAILWLQIGIATFGVISVVALVLGLKSYVASLLATERLRYLKYADERVKIMNEIITGMRVIKMYAWEKSFAKVVTAIRKKEIKHILRIAYMRAFLVTMQFVSPLLMLYFSVVMYGLFGNRLDIVKIFTVFSLLQGIRTMIIFCVPESIQNASETSVSLKRIGDYLLSEELHNPDTLHYSENNNTIHDVPVEVTNLSVWWTDESRLILKDMSFKVEKGELCAIVGSVGSGKSTLLVTLLHDVMTLKGNYRIQGKSAYASQQAWIISDSLRNNILFGQEYDVDKYNKVIDACALRKDLELLPNGDMTYVGERGVQLSGGQRMRVSLARAVYYDADIYLLDDPLSAVDANVAKHIYQKCICGILKNKTRILVTHQLHHLRSANKIIVLKDGSIKYIDTFENLQAKSEFFSKTTEEQSAKNIDNQQPEVNMDIPEFSGKLPNQMTSNDTMKIIEEEARMTGSVPWKLYADYLVSVSGIIPAVLACALFLISQASVNAADWWFSQWSFTYQNASSLINGSVESNTVLLFGLSNVNVIAIYAGILVFATILISLRSWTIAKIAIKASEHFESKLFHSMLQTVIHIFDVYPAGRILNRFSKDCAQMDDQIGYSLLFTIQCFLVVIGQLVMMSVVNPWMLIPITVVSVIFIFLRRYYLYLSRDVKRLEAAGSSPIYSHMSTTLQGLTTLRAYKASNRFLQQFKEYTDRHNINPALAALLLSYALNSQGLVDWAVRFSAELENQMTSVERVKEYTKLPKEKDYYKISDLSSDWPKFGKIEFKDVSFAHADHLPYVLKSISCKIKPFEKVGIVGRTGAGKSSFLASLFRLSEPRGEILIDNVVANNIGLHCLRSAISVIPQDPVLFVGTIRKNLDPFDSYDDEQLWKALHEVEMGNYVSQLPNKLNNEVTEFGANFSVGQRQLLCLARALLKKNRILCIDEATANVDMKTDTIIQHTIRNKFTDCTMLIIAHRLRTIIHCNRVLVLEEGRIVEFDSPHNLLQMNGYFNKLVTETGNEESRNLRIQAERYHNSRETSEEADKEIMSSVISEKDFSFKGHQRKIEMQQQQ
ncbi:uncharacterized protein TRIADDRAFT_54972 [Trichoplax adhaerens]|uniref:Uncharacterized protein n=1 Tax=Trichoplax adhaerens TaxID=10228 RepID=B3RQF8_TRIAD|nr:hypothetical protein TRIADDRAFT_54972 [Trichoplax adhaerens]EDV27233.1 hypothetical protein TRIADDRAFT_54972 [Trichoplax adhaerens]|eukprot:XP_002111229.1 hypothetical protein TRIADDRAFT_54972 [Trichoplax adhaerens]